MGDETYLFIPHCQLSQGIDTHFVLWHEGNFKEPVYLLTNLELGPLATGYYQKRFRIETLFKELKSQGFSLYQSKLSDPAKVERLLIICGLAYLWLVGLGTILVAKRGWVKRMYKVHKDTFNLFIIGKRLYNYLIKNGLRIPNIFQYFLKIKVSV